jgi:hypothetical protein
LPTLIVFTESRAYRAALEKLACREIAHQGNRKCRRLHRKNRNRSRRGTRPHPPSFASFHLLPCGSWVWRLCATCRFHPKMHNPAQRKISAGAKARHNHSKSLLLRRNRLRSAKPRGAAPTCVHARRLMARNQNAPLKTRHLQSVRFSAVLPRNVPQGRRLSAQRCTTTNRTTIAAPRITKAKDSHLLKIGFIPKKALRIRRTAPAPSPVCRTGAAIART